MHPNTARACQFGPFASVSLTGLTTGASLSIFELSVGSSINESVIYAVTGSSPASTNSFRGFESISSGSETRPRRRADSHAAKISSVA